MLNNTRNVVSGLEGCGKSSKVFQHLEKNATTDKPILFGVKNYRLMMEQLDNWSTRFNLPKEQFAICGFNLEYEPAKEAYTNKSMPFEIAPTVRFVFTSQAIIQRNRHTEFINSDGDFIQYSHIVIDEFDFTCGIIPSLDYELSSMRNDSIKTKTEEQKLQWIVENYTTRDRTRILRKKFKHDSSFLLAYWIDSCECPLTFLTSEVLAVRFLKLLGFTEVYIDSPNFKDCIVNTWSSKLIGRNFFNKMNQYVGWNKLNYDLIISDCISGFFESSNTLDIAVINHTSIRGSNSWKNKNILSIISYIPNQVIAEIRDTFNSFGDDINFDHISSLFYRDRLCQAVGRVVGNRGSNQTDLIIHSDLLDVIEKNNVDFPYTFNTKWKFDFDGFDFILDKVVQVEQYRKTKSTQVSSIKNYDYLDDLFIVDPDFVLPVSVVKDFLKQHHLKSLPVSKIAHYFNCRIKNVRTGSDKKPTRCLIGLNFL